MSKSYGISQLLNDDRGGYRNKIINGGFYIWQRGVSYPTPSPSTYPVDGWVHNHNGTIGAFNLRREPSPGRAGDLPERQQ